VSEPEFKGGAKIVRILFCLNPNLLNFRNSQNFRNSKKFNNSFNSSSDNYQNPINPVQKKSV